MTQERDLLRGSHERLRLELELLKRRLFVAKAERIDTAQLEMEFAEKLRQLDALAGTSAMTHAPPDTTTRRQEEAKSTGRRDLKKLPLEEERVEIPDPLYERLVADGKAARIGFEESCKLGWKRGGMRRVVLARVKYQVTAPGSEHPRSTPRRCRRSSSPGRSARRRCSRTSSCRSTARECRSSASRTPSPAMAAQSTAARCAGGSRTPARPAARRSSTPRDRTPSPAFCIATDATGVLVQPIRTHEKVRKPCKRGHYFVHIADRDHVFFEYTAKENSDAVRAMFRGYSGYVQADAKSVYDVLFREPDKSADDDDGALRYEVGCLAHCRREILGGRHRQERRRPRGPRKARPCLRARRLLA